MTSASAVATTATSTAATTATDARRIAVGTATDARRIAVGMFFILLSGMIFAVMSALTRVVSDAGMPSISDPGYKIVREAINNDIEIVSIPGASAVLAALVSSGVPTDRFLFEGFLPPKKGRLKKIERVIDFDGTLVYYESPHRLVKSLKQFSEILGNRPAAVARELTKVHEEIKRGRLIELLSFYSEKKVKGECVILIGKDDENVYF